MPRIRSMSHITGSSNKQSSLRSSLRHRKQTNKVPCDCKDCKGKLVAKRTRLFHMSSLGNNSANTSLSSIIQLPSEAPEISEDFGAELPQTSASATIIQETQNQQMVDINPEQ